jgi:hypothetical protein
MENTGDSSLQKNMKRNYIQECEFRISALLRAKFKNPGSEEHLKALERYDEIKQMNPKKWLAMQSNEGESSAFLE